MVFDKDEDEEVLQPNFHSSFGRPISSTTGSTISLSPPTGPRQDTISSKLPQGFADTTDSQKLGRYQPNYLELEDIMLPNGRLARPKPGGIKQCSKQLT